MVTLSSILEGIINDIRDLPNVSLSCETKNLRLKQYGQCRFCAVDTKIRLGFSQISGVPPVSPLPCTQLVCIIS